MKHFLPLAVSFIFIFNFIDAGFCEDIWEPIAGIKESGLKEVSAAPDNQNVIYAASAKTLYQTEDKGITWKAVFSVQAGDDMINFIRVSDKGVFVCAKNSVFASGDGRAGWKKIFNSIGEKENNVMHIAFSGDKRVYIATDNGFYLSNDSGVTWHRDNIDGAGDSAKWVEFLGSIILVATEKGVYKNSGEGWKRTFVTKREGIEYDADSADESLKAVKPVNSMAVDKDAVFLAADSGIFTSEDKGETWNSFINTGLLSLGVRRILSCKGLYAVTDRGVFIFSDKDKIWRSLYKGMATTETNSIAADFDGNLWVATNKGLYKSNPYAITGFSTDDNLYKEKQGIFKRFENEPAIEDVQKAAIEYAEVHPDKIKEWRNSANKKALLPNVSVGLDRYVTDYWHWDAGTNPDTLQKGKDTVSWDLTMTWDMGELIWNSDQTSIDTRSKLMVELRDDIMNEVTRTYFERRRLQVEMLASPPKDLKVGLEKELRLQELTADINALTGGYFSRQLEQFDNK